MTEHEKRAAEIFRQQGLPFQTAKRAKGGWTNAVWLNGDAVLRLSQHRDRDRLRREMELAKLLPAPIGYPATIAMGIEAGYEWCLSERVQGQNLSRVWKKLRTPEKEKALRQIFAMARSVHAVDVRQAERFSSRQAWYSSFDRDTSMADMERYAAKNIFTPAQRRSLRDMLERFYDSLARAPAVLNHGDITMDNLLWRDGDVVSLLDFEGSVIAPPQLDLHSLANLDVNLTAGLCKPFLAGKDEEDLLLGYAILFRMRFLEFWIEERRGRLSKNDAYQKLAALSEGNGGYLAELLT